MEADGGPAVRGYVDAKLPLHSSQNYHTESAQAVRCVRPTDNSSQLEQLQARSMLYRNGARRSHAQ